MKKHLLYLVFSLVLLCCSAFTGWHTQENSIVSYTVSAKSEIAFYWKDEHSEVFGSIGQLKNWLAHKGRKLTFAMNGGMYTPEQAPVGLYIERQKVLARLHTSTGSGNFGLKPNGVFYLTKDKQAVVCQTDEFKQSENITFATQSGPMLVINGAIHPAFKKGSFNLNIRNGVGILPDGQILFAISEEMVNFYDFADYFKSKGCLNALYLDGFVSRMYLPEKNRLQTDGQFGVIIGVTVDAI